MDYTEFNDEVDGLYRGDYAGLPMYPCVPRALRCPPPARRRGGSR